MKKIMILLVLALAACKSSKEATISVDKKDTVLFYSKGPCLGKCPVYNLRVFSDGMVVYESRDAQRKKVSVISRLSQEEIAELTDILENSLGEPTLFKRIRDRPVTILKCNDKEYEFHASKIDGLLKTVNTKIEDLVAQVQVE